MSIEEKLNHCYQHDQYSEIYLSLSLSLKNEKKKPIQIYKFQNEVTSSKVALFLQKSVQNYW